MRADIARLVAMLKAGIDVALRSADPQERCEALDELATYTRDQQIAASRELDRS